MDRILCLRKSIRILGALLCAVLAATGCSDKSPTGSSGGAEGAPSAAGTWGLVRIQTVQNDSVIAETVFPADSSIQYIVINDTAVFQHVLDDDEWNPRRYLHIGDYADSTLRFPADSFTVVLTGAEMQLALFETGDFAISRYIYQRYTGDVPPGHWPDITVDVDDDIYEPDDRIADATVLTAGQPPQLHTFSGYDYDYFKIDLQPGVLYRMNLSDTCWEFSPDFFDAGNNSLYRYEIDSIHIEYSDQNIDIVAEQAMTLYIRLDNYDDGPVYMVSLTAETDDPYEDDDTLATANPLIPGQAAQQHKLLPGDADWFRIDLQAGLLYYIEFSDDIGNYRISLFNEDADRVVGGGAVALGAGRTSYSMIAQTEMTLYLRVGYDDMPDYSIAVRSQSVQPVPLTGDYFLADVWLNFQGPDTGYIDQRSYTSDNTPNVYRFLSNSLQLHSYYDYEYYVSNAILIHLDGFQYLLSGDTVSISESNGNLVLEASIADGDKTESLRATFKPYSGSVPPSFWLTGPLPPASAVLLQEGQDMQGALVEGAEDWYRFSAVAWESFVVYDGEFNCNILLFSEEDGHLVRIYDYSYGWGVDTEYRRFNTTIGSTYYIAVKAWDGSPGDYTLSVASSAPEGLYKPAQRSIEDIRLRIPLPLGIKSR